MGKGIAFLALGGGVLYLFWKWNQSSYPTSGEQAHYSGVFDGDPYAPLQLQQAIAGQRTALPGNAPAQPAAPAGAGRTTGGQVAGGIATAGATTAATVATTGVTALTGALTFGIGAGAALLTWGIADQGWFRGGEVGVKVNPARDQFLLQFGPGGTEPGTSGFGRLAAALTEITGEPDGSHYFKALIGATTMDQLRDAEREIARVLATRGYRVTTL